MRRSMTWLLAQDFGEMTLVQFIRFERLKEAFR
jgi:hypothetical protein